MNYVRLKNLRPEVGFEVFPQVYCVAYNESYRTEFWKQGPGGQWNKLEANPIFHEKLGRDKTYYIRATGSCKGKDKDKEENFQNILLPGDSGGPLFEKDGRGRFVVLGTTSRGTGPIGNCGGKGNPTHYVR